MTPERKKEYKDSIDSALALLMDFRAALDKPRIVSSRCAYCDETFDEVESGECPPALLEHAKTCPKSPPANEIKRLRKELMDIQVHAFACMEGSGMPKFEEYDRIATRARKALEDKP